MISTGRDQLDDLGAHGFEFGRDAESLDMGDREITSAGVDQHGRDLEALLELRLDLGGERSEGDGRGGGRLIWRGFLLFAPPSKLPPGTSLSITRARSITVSLILLV